MAGYWLKYGNSVMHKNGYAIGKPSYDPYNPLALPPNTIRIKYNPYFTPRMGDSQTLVDATNNIWDVTYNSDDWSSLFRNESSLLEVLGANTSSVTSMYQTFYNCIYLTNVNVFDTGAVVNMQDMFHGATNLVNAPQLPMGSVTNAAQMFLECTHLTTVPMLDLHSVVCMDSMFYRTERLSSVPTFNTISVQSMGSAFELSGITAIPPFNTNSVTNMDAAFRDCRAVQSGALALYQQASGQAYVPTHSQTFKNCGSSTVTGAQELASIPTSWGGTMAE